MATEKMQETGKNTILSENAKLYERFRYAHIRYGSYDPFYTGEITEENEITKYAYSMYDTNPSIIERLAVSSIATLYLDKGLGKGCGSGGKFVAQWRMWPLGSYNSYDVGKDRKRIKEIASEIAQTMKDNGMKGIILGGIQCILVAI